MASFFFDRASVSLGASGAVFGLFAVAVLLKLKFSFQKLVRPYYESAQHSRMPSQCHSSAHLWIGQEQRCFAGGGSGPGAICCQAGLAGE